MSLVLGGGTVYARPWCDIASGDCTLAGRWKPGAGMLIGDRWIAAITNGASAYLGLGMFGGSLRGNLSGQAYPIPSGALTSGWNSVIVSVSSDAAGPYQPGTATVRCWLNGVAATPATVAGFTQSQYAVVALGNTNTIAGGDSAIAGGKFAEWSVHGCAFSNADATAHAAGADARGLPCVLDAWPALDNLLNRRGSRPLQMVGTATFDADHPTIAAWPVPSGRPRIVRGAAL